MSQMTELQHPTKPGEMIYKTIQVGLACRACAKKGKKCTHNMKHVPQHCKLQTQPNKRKRRDRRTSLVLRVLCLYSERRKASDSTGYVGSR